MHVGAHPIAVLVDPVLGRITHRGAGIRSSRGLSEKNPDRQYPPRYKGKRAFCLAGYLDLQC